jgi:signal transduction histidine kinase
VREPPAELAKVEPRIDLVKAQALLAREPRVKPEALARIATHLKTTLELVIFSSHKAYVTSKLHLHSVTSSFRELEEKTRRLEQALARSRELDRLKSNFLATVSHELRTPLTSIIGYSEMLAEGLAGPLNGEQEAYVKTIYGKGEQLLALITGLLDLTKMESGTMRLRQGDVQLAQVLTDVVSTLAPVARKKGVELALSVSDDTARTGMDGDAERLRQVFTNLVDNAVKFTPAGGHVRLAARVVEASDVDDGPAILLAPVRKELEVVIADSGIGIPSRERERVFDPFYQIDSSSTRQHGGTGLGLSIVKRIVEAHGGSVRIEENEPTGAAFVVTFPSAQAKRTLPRSVPPPT